MIVIFEGIDRVGKDTQIKLFQKYMFNSHNKLFHQLHCSGFTNKNLTTNELKSINSKYYEEMFELMKNNDFILNRSHLGEYVYGNMYRNYDGSYVLDLEKHNIDIMKRCYLIMLLDSVDNVLSREDDDSLTKEGNKKQKEIDLFEEVFNKSIAEYKILINIKGKSIDCVHNEIIEFIKGNANEMFLC